MELVVIGMADRLRRAGALVVGIDTRAFVKSLESSGSCAYPAGALEELARDVQLRLRLPQYQRPIVVGYSSGATLAYAAIAAAPPETFAGAISLGFCPRLELRTAPCRMRGLEAARPPQGKAPVFGYDLAPFRDSTVPWSCCGEADQVARLTDACFVARTGRPDCSRSTGGTGFGVTATGRRFLEAYNAVAGRARPRAEPRALRHGRSVVVELPARLVDRRPRRHGCPLTGTRVGDIDKSPSPGLGLAACPSSPGAA